MKNTSTIPWYRRKAVIAAVLVVTLIAGAHLTLSWPHNFLGKVVYRILGKPMPPKRSEDLANIRQFLKAKRLLDRKDYAQARLKLEDLRARIQPNFLFFREIYFFLGYIYDIQGDFKKEESLYSELQGKDVVLAKFLYGLYYFRHGQETKAREFLSSTLALDQKYHRLNNEFRSLLHSTMAQISRQDKGPRAPAR
ncbi:MAG: tetratricopeptide repeat protein [Geobacteraceae bacterium]|nr:tetratricopeptide repeat protein [Geobacteraceae bacterium]